ncbi:MAG: hypothetical protein RR302_03525 [Victivallaceae bacterium]
MLSFMRNGYLRFVSFKSIFVQKRLSHLGLVISLRNNIRPFIDLKGICFSLILHLLALLQISEYSGISPALYSCLYISGFFFVFLFSFWGVILSCGIVIALSTCLLFTFDNLHDILWMQGAFLVLHINYILLFLGLLDVQDIREGERKIYDERLGVIAQEAESSKTLSRDLLLLKEQSEKKIKDLTALLELKEMSLVEINHQFSFIESERQFLIKNRSAWLNDYQVLHHRFIELKDEYQSSSTCIEDKNSLLKKISDLQMQSACLEEQKMQLLDQYTEINEIKDSISKDNRQLQEKIMLLEQEITTLNQRPITEILETVGDRTNISEQICESQDLSIVYRDMNNEYKRRYLQLREQFKDKDRHLFTSRQELFNVKDKLNALKIKEELFLESEPDDLHIIGNLLDVISELEKEIILLEELVSHSRNM